jgi:hypothetical protein
MSTKLLSARLCRPSAIVLAAAATVAGLLLAVPAAAAQAVPSPTRPAASQPCDLANGISHVVRIQFDNVHLTRDDPNVPSDLEQMPNLDTFLRTNGVEMANAHDVLVHTATNFVSNLTGLYPDRTAITQSNSFNYYDSSGATHPGVSFAYWTDPIYDYTGANKDTNYNLQYTADRHEVPNTSNVNVPAPWVPYTRAGCNVGNVGMANTVLENIATDIPTVFGAGSPQQHEATTDPTKATADYVGYAVHCAATSTLCAAGQTDALPDEPGGYHGYRALFGNAEIEPAISPAGPVRALNGTPIADAQGNIGFPGFDSLTPTNSLGYAAQMLEHGVQVANVYVSDAHSDHTSAATGDLGPGSTIYEQQLSDYNAAFGQFLTRLAGDGITPANTLFVVTGDEGDHFSGSAPTPAGCTGIDGNYCSYTTRSEVNVNLVGLLASQANNRTPFAIHSDPAPALWVRGNPAPGDPAVRALERDIAGLSVVNPLTGDTDKVATYLADPVEQKILHFVSSDPARTPTLTFFSGEDEYIGGGAPNCDQPCVYTSSGYAWNHGGIWPDMQNIWAGYAGPGISARGVDHSVWTDQTDTRPTLLALTGLHDDYQVDGRVLVEIASPAALPRSLRAHHETVRQLGVLYKQILGSAAEFAQDTLAYSTRGLSGGSATDDHQYGATEVTLTWLDTWRDRIADQIGAQLLGAAFHATPVNERTGRALIGQAQLLLHTAHRLAGNGG